VPIVVLGQQIDLYCYHPEKFAGQQMIMVIHGMNRNADEYRDHCLGLAERTLALIVAPKFDDRRFPSLKFQRGGILDQDGKATSPLQWTYRFIPEIADRVRELVALPKLKLAVIGHSAGGQFVVRMAAFGQPRATSLVAANPGSLLMPTSDLPFGYGFGGLPSELVKEQRLKDYLAAPLTLYLGTMDNVQDEYLDVSSQAMMQGPGRHQRGLACFNMAKQLAEERGWSFGWRLVEAEGIGHDHQAMFDHPNCEVALRLDATEPLNQRDLVDQ
jgi:pimeloyl-ACP methyl ester carboxylesterase